MDRNPQLCSRINFVRLVTPLAGVWIEIASNVKEEIKMEVPPLAGVWIEIMRPKSRSGCPQVTPLAGVWIEMEDKNHATRC